MIRTNWNRGDRLAARELRELAEAARAFDKLEVRPPLYKQKKGSGTVIGIREDRQIHRAVRKSGEVGIFEDRPEIVALPFDALAEERPSWYLQWVPVRATHAGYVARSPWPQNIASGAAPTLRIDAQMGGGIGVAWPGTTRTQYNFLPSGATSTFAPLPSQIYKVAWVRSEQRPTQAVLDSLSDDGVSPLYLVQRWAERFNQPAEPTLWWEVPFIYAG